MPWRTMLASAVPMASTRRRTVSMAALMALVMRCCRPGSVGVRVITPAFALLRCRCRDAGAEQGVADRLDQAAQLLQRGIGVLGLGEADLHGVVGDAERR